LPIITKMIYFPVAYFQIIVQGEILMIISENRKHSKKPNTL